MQAEMNIGMLGHVDHGKTTLTKALTGKWTDTHSEEAKRGISIRLGYADAHIYQCSKCKSYQAKEKCSCGGKGKEVRKISIVDAPGHETLMTTVISATSMLDGVIFLIAANEQCPQPQTAEHLLVLNSTGLKNIIVVQTKIDLVSKEQALENHKQIKAFLKRAKANDCKVHGLGFTAQNHMRYLPFYSVDSSSWIAGNRYGSICRFDGRRVNTIQRQPGRRERCQQTLAQHNFLEWVKFCNYAEENL